jgi:hypothetical protein
MLGGPRRCRGSIFFSSSLQKKKGAQLTYAVVENDGGVKCSNICLLRFYQIF